jgi:hypothetical protein
MHDTVYSQTEENKKWSPIILIVNNFCMDVEHTKLSSYLVFESNAAVICFCKSASANIGMSLASAPVPSLRRIQHA